MPPGKSISREEALNISQGIIERAEEERRESITMTFIAWLRVQQSRADEVGAFAQYYFSVPGIYRPRGRLTQAGMDEWLLRREKTEWHDAAYAAHNEWRRKARTVGKSER